MTPCLHVTNRLRRLLTVFTLSTVELGRQNGVLVTRKCKYIVHAKQKKTGNWPLRL